MTLSGALMILLGRNKLSYRDLAKRLCMNPAWVRKWIDGECDPSLMNIKLITKLLNERIVIENGEIKVEERIVR